MKVKYICSLCFFLALFGIANTQSDVLQPKIYIKDGIVNIGKVIDKQTASIIRSPLDSIIDVNSEYILMVAISDLFDYKIKYCFIDENIITLSLWDSSVSFSGRFIDNPKPDILAIPTKDLESIQSNPIQRFLKTSKRTAPYIEFHTLLHKTPIKEYFSIKNESQYYHDLSSTEDEIYLTYQKLDTLQIWEYKLPKSDTKISINDRKVKSEKIVDIVWEEDENFYTFILDNEIYLVTQSGIIYYLDKKNRKVKRLIQLPNNLDTFSLIVNKDQQRIFYIETALINKKQSFNKLIKNFAQEINLNQIKGKR